MLSQKCNAFHSGHLKTMSERTNNCSVNKIAKNIVNIIGKNNQNQYSQDTAESIEQPWELHVVLKESLKCKRVTLRFKWPPFSVEDISWIRLCPAAQLASSSLQLLVFLLSWPLFASSSDGDTWIAFCSEKLTPTNTTRAMTLMKETSKLTQMELILDTHHILQQQRWFESIS